MAAAERRPGNEGVHRRMRREPPLRKFYPNLYVQVLVAIAIGIGFGILDPDRAAAMKPLGDGFIKLVKMLIAPIVFTTLVVGIAEMGAMKQVGRIGLRALVYFEISTIFALAIALAIVHVLRPGAGVGFDPASADMNAVSAYTTTVQEQRGTVDFLLNIIPDTVIGAFARGDVLQVVVFAVLFGVALLSMGARAAPLVALIATASDALFTMVGMIMRLAPIGAFGAMAFTIGEYGVGSLWSLGQLMLGVYLACLGYVFLVLGPLAMAAGFSLIKFLKYIGEEILIVLGTSSSESVLPRIMKKLEHLGCAKPVVGLVVPTGYSFNLDGTAIYMAIGMIFVAQASGVQLTLGQELGMLAVLLVTSKGAAAVTGSGFVTLAATLAAFPTIPIAGLTLLLGVDRFMSEARAITNLIGNAVATMIVARWDGALDLPRARAILDGEPPPSEVVAEVIVTYERAGEAG
jgi:aerobic C4-dicarboxylate transport protein